MSESEPSYSKSGADKSAFPWYLDNIDKRLTPKTQEILLNYSGIPLDQQSKHVHEIRDKAWAIRTYPCTGLGVFIDPYISYSPAYPKILETLKSGGSMLDVGCLLGGDFRRLVVDGAPSDRMYGVDIVSHWDVGFDMYRDKDHFKAKFIEVDILSETDPELLALEGKMDVISVSAVLHQWSWEKQVQAAKRLIKFSSGKGTIILGHQIGNSVAKEVELRGVHAWRQSAEAFVKLWDQAGSETGTKWETEARLLPWGALGWDPKDHTWMQKDDTVLEFVVTRVE